MVKEFSDHRLKMDQSTKLRDKFKLEKCNLSYADLHSEVVKNVDNMTSSSGLRTKQFSGSKVGESEEIVKHMSNLPSYLERGKKFQDKALNFGVMDWGRLEKWHFTQKQVPYENSKDSPSSSNSSSYFSTDGSSNLSSRGHSCSPACQKSHRPTLRSHFSASPSPQQLGTPCVKLPAGNHGKCQELKDAPGDRFSSPKTTIRQYEAFHKNQMETRLKKCRDSPGMTSSSKGKMKIKEDESAKGREKLEDQYYCNYDHHCFERSKTVVLLLPRDGPGGHPNDKRSTEASCPSFSEGSHLKEIHRSVPLESEVDSVKHSKMETNSIDRESSSGPSPAASSANIPASPLRSKNPKDKMPTMSSKGSDPKMDTVAPSKVRSLSPLRRLSIGMSKIGRNSISRDSSTTPPQLTSKFFTSKSGLDRAETSVCSDKSIKDYPNPSSRDCSSPLRRFSSSSRDSSAIPQMGSKFVTSKSRSDRAEASDNLVKDNPNVLSRALSSPLRRLLDPLFPAKATNSHQSAEPLHENSKIKVKSKLDMGSYKENIIHDSHRNGRNGSETTQALFQIAVKNGRPLFTFSVENNSDVLAATVRRLNSPMKDGSRWIYTFFTVQEVKKKNASWLNPSSKGKGHGYVPNVVAQMKVSDALISNREFVLFSVDSRQLDQQILDVHPRDEMAAIVVKFPRKAIREDSEDHFSTTVILPGGHHGLPSKGEPSPLIERWRSGGLCDCGGWDMGCRMRVLGNQNQTNRKSNASRVHLPRDQFELFSQGEFQNEGPFFSMSPIMEGIYSVEFHPTLSLLQAFSTCISVLDCRKSSQLSESSDFFEEKVPEETTALKQEEVPVRYASYPPLSPVGRV